MRYGLTVYVRRVRVFVRIEIPNLRGVGLQVVV